MMDMSQFQAEFVETSLIFRVLTAFVWGWGYGLILHKTKRGRLFEREHTWLATVIGIAVDLVIAFPGGWLIVTAVIAASSIGIMVLAMIYGYPDDVRLNKYRAKHLLEDANATAMRLQKHLLDVVKLRDLPDPALDRISEAMSLVQDIRGQLTEIRLIARGIK